MIKFRGRKINSFLRRKLKCGFVLRVGRVGEAFRDPLDWSSGGLTG